MGGEPWDPSEATRRIRAIAKHHSLNVTYTHHAREQMLKRDLILGDVLYVLKNGFVHDSAQASTRPGYYKYRMQTSTPNSGQRDVRVVVIPDERSFWVKVVTVMWVDEP
ncbi:DUF4258 domain-containing protein [Salinarimonas sp.]|uniref:DUF4258 domain-containing protein n=1 Tax=Salinarimonas sp. TaxID=2766526 RepID=UPI0032D8F3FF